MKSNHMISKLVGDEVRGQGKWISSICGKDGSIYGIPFDAQRRILRFNPGDHSRTYVGPYFGTDTRIEDDNEDENEDEDDNDDDEDDEMEDLDVWGMWRGGVLANDGFIYCPPYNADKILKIDTTRTDTCTITLMDLVLPEQGICGRWASGAPALDGCIYFMPAGAHHILKLDPNGNDGHGTVSSVGMYLGIADNKYLGTVAGMDGFIYGIPHNDNRIIKYDPVTEVISFLGELEDELFECHGGAVGRDGNIYALMGAGRILKIDIELCAFSFNYLTSTLLKEGETFGWTNAIAGKDGCIYWVPGDSNRILKYDPQTEHNSFVGELGADEDKWYSGCSTPDGTIYCIPFNALRVLMIIDPFKDFTVRLKRDMEQYPEQLGLLFLENDEGITAYDSEVTKFGPQKVFQAVVECLPPADQLFAASNLYPFIVGASCHNSTALSVIYFLLRQVPSLISSTNVSPTA